MGDEKKVRKKIAHILQKEKFTTGYVNFFKIQMTQYDHVFIIREHEFEKHPFKPLDSQNIYFVKYKKLLRFRTDIMKELEKSDLIIVSGFWDWVYGVSYLPQKIMDKLYIQFWGGDFYDLVKNVSIVHLRTWLRRQARKYSFRKCKGYIFLIKGEYEKFKSITGYEKPNYIASMPMEPINNSSQRNIHFLPHDGINILVGNSATKSNQHLDAFSMLKHMKLENTRIYVPLSYGEDNYRKMIIKEGKKLFGNAFQPITEFMTLDDYREFLKDIDVAIFNNNRQQAMGNINTLLSYGKKVYIRTDTSMWDQYLEKGYTIYPTEEIKDINFQDLVRREEGKMIVNMENFEEKNGTTYDINVWNSFLNSVVGGGVLYYKQKQVNVVRLHISYLEWRYAA